MKFCFFMLIAVLLLTGTAKAADLPAELRQALPQQAQELMEDMGPAENADLSGTFAALGKAVGSGWKKILRQQTKGAAALLAAVLLCGFLESIYHGTGGSGDMAFLPMAGALTITAASSGGLDTLIGLGRETISQLKVFSDALLPTLAAACAAGGAAASASIWQVTTVFAVELFLHLTDGLLIPMLYLYIGLLTAGSCLAGRQILALAEMLKKIMVWIMTSVLVVFTLYLSTTRILSGSADRMTVRMTKMAISGAVPIVGGIIADVSETMLAGAGMVRSTIGVFGTVGILAACAYPFLKLGIQYILYKIAAFLAGAVGPESLSKLVDGLGNAFGLILGMTGACALLLLVSVLMAITAVTG